MTLPQPPAPEPSLSASDPPKVAPPPAIAHVKLTNGTDNHAPTGPVVPVGSPVTWTYRVTNTGNVPVTAL